MKMFKKYGNDISYRDILQVDGADATCHVLYGKSPIFNGISAKNIEDELKQAKNEFVKYHLELVKQETFFLPIEHSIRNILVIKKKS